MFLLRYHHYIYISSKPPIFFLFAVSCFYKQCFFNILSLLQYVSSSFFLFDSDSEEFMFTVVNVFVVVIDVMMYCINLT